MDEQTVFRSDGRCRNYTKISNGLLQDRRLTHETKGLLCELLSRSGDWEITVPGIVATGRSKRDRVYRMLGEAIEFGYIRDVSERRADGTLPRKVYIVSDEPELIAEQQHAPLTEKPEVVSLPNAAQPDPAQPDPDFPTQQIKESNKSKIKQSSAATREPSSLDRLRERLLAASGGIVTSLSMTEPQRWLANGFDLEADILPVIEAKARQWKQGRIASWAFFTKIIADAKATRLAPVPEGSPAKQASARTPHWREKQEADYQRSMRWLARHKAKEAPAHVGV